MLETKARREERLTVQSRVVVGIVLGGCSYDLLVYCLRHNYLAGGFWVLLLISCCFGLVVYHLKAATPLGASLGALITLQLLSFTGMENASLWGQCLHSGMVPELVLFLLVLIATRFGKHKKDRLGIAEDKIGRKAGQIAANLGPSILAVFLFLFILKAVHEYSSQAAALSAIPLLAALAEATADTLSSELGQVLRTEPRMITSFKQVPAGTDGAISFAGTLAGSLGALLVVLAGTWAFGLNLFSAVIALASAVFGLLLDSLLGATLERQGWLNNDAVNFLSGIATLVVASLLTWLEIGHILIV